MTSYTGFRTVSRGVVDGIERPLLNGEFIFFFGTLDQGASKIAVDLHDDSLVVPRLSLKISTKGLIADLEARADPFKSLRRFLA